MPRTQNVAKMGLLVMLAGLVVIVAGAVAPLFVEMRLDSIILVLVSGLLLCYSGSITLLIGLATDK